MEPLTFADPRDYDKVEQGDRVSIAGLGALAPGRPLTVTLRKVAGRTVPRQTPDRAATRVVGGVILLASAILLLMLTEAHVSGVADRQRFIQLVFEARSAFGTVGLSMGVTPTVTPAGRLVLGEPGLHATRNASMKRFVVIGLGRLGSSVGRALHRQGLHVIALDRPGHRLHHVSHQVTRAIARPRGLPRGRVRWSWGHPAARCTRGSSACP